jgi:hypothetical protein
MNLPSYWSPLDRSVYTMSLVWLRSVQFQFVARALRGSPGDPLGQAWTWLPSMAERANKPN